MHWLSFITLLSVSAFVQAETLYVCGSGSGSGLQDGSSAANCWDGGSAVDWNATDETVGEVDPGDILCLIGTHSVPDNTERIGNDFISGTSGNAITVDGDCDGDGVKAIIDGEGTGIGLFHFDNEDYITIQNVVCRDSAGTCLTFSDAGGSDQERNVTITNSEFYNCGTICIGAFGALLTVTNNACNGAGTDCVFISGGRGLTFSGNRLVNPSTAGTEGDGLQIANAGVDDIGTITITDNYCDHTQNSYKHCFLVPLGDATGGTLVMSRNIALCAAGVDADSCHPFVVDCKNIDHNVTVSRNYGYLGQRGIWFQDCDLTSGLISSNILDGANETAIYLDNDTDQIVVEGNTAINAGVGISVNKATSNTNVLRSNLIAGNITGLSTVSEPTHEYNHYSNDTNYSGSLDATEFVLDPHLSGFVPRVSARGRRVQALLDFKGRVRSQQAQPGAIDLRAGDYPVFQ